MRALPGGRGRVLGVAFATLAIVASGLRLSTTATPQQVTFRSGVDLVAVDAQVVDKDGAPIGDLTADKFEVWINGQARKVVSADLIQYPLQTPRSLAPSIIDTPGAIERTDLPPVTGRVFVLAIDELSFSVQAMAQVVRSVKQFVSSLPSEDVVAAYAYPYGNAQIDLTHYHNQVGVQLGRLQGVRLSDVSMSGGDLFLTPAEIVDIAANDSSAMESAYERECLVNNAGAAAAAISRSTGTAVSRNDVQLSAQSCIDRDSGQPPSMNSSCALRIKSQANQTAGVLESIASMSFNGVRELLGSLKAVPGPKVVVLVSAGLLASDRSGGRPDVTSMMSATGQLAADANASLYVLHFDGSLMDLAGASGTATAFNGCQRALSNAVTQQSRTDELIANGLERIAGQASGEYLRIIGGDGTNAFNRILKETSA